jgi:hypothetical protein
VECTPRQDFGKRMNTLDIDTLNNGTTLIVTDDFDRNFTFRKDNGRWWLVAGRFETNIDENAIRGAITEASFITIKETN